MKKYLILICIYSLTACQYSREYIDDKNLKEEADLQVEKFYEFTTVKNYSEISKMFSKEFYNVSTVNELYEFLNKVNIKLGDYKDRKLIKWSNVRKTESLDVVSYLMIYKIKYSKYESEEKFILKKIGNVIKIIGYDVKSDNLNKG